MATAVDPLSVDVDLAVTIDGRECMVWNEGDRLVLNAPSLATARSLLTGVEALPVEQRRLVAELVRADLVAEIRVRHATVARLGADHSPSWLAALAGTDAAISPGGLAVAIWRWLL
jgi:hypothetical protein